MGTIPLQIIYRKIINLDYKTRIVNSKESSITGPTGKDVQGISYQKSTTPISQPMKNHAFLQWTFI